VTTLHLGETNSGVKAVLKDASGAIDLVSWGDGLSQTLVEYEGDTVAVRNAEVSEYEGDHQLGVVDGLTTVEPIQRGVGFTESAPAESGQGDLNETPSEAAEASEASTDGGPKYDGPIGQVAEYLRRDGGTVGVPELAGALGLEPSIARKAAENLAAKGDAIERGSGFALND
jgi:hypothetical protein